MSGIFSQPKSESPPKEALSHITPILAGEVNVGRYIVLNNKPCKVTEVRRIQKYIKEARGSQPFAFLGGHNLMTGNPQEEILPVDFPLETVLCSFTKHPLDSIDKGWLVSGEERFMMPFKSDKSLCMQIIGYYEQQKRQ